MLSPREGQPRISGRIRREKVFEAIFSELTNFELNAKKIMARSAVVDVHGRKAIYSMICPNAEAAIDVFHALEQEGLEVPSGEEGGSI